MLTITVYVDDDKVEIQVAPDTNLRNILLNHDLSPYTQVTRRFNCGGRGLCATCGVWIDEAIDPEHWHDRAASIFGYPRLSCQITVQKDMTVRLVTDKWIWGRRDADKGTLFSTPDNPDL